jgi:alpha-tubulin suppressor-like RCC1 family protein
MAPFGPGARITFISSATTSTVVAVPTQVPGLSGITQIDLSSEGNGYAVGPGGNVWAWGANNSGQLGNGDAGYELDPCQPVRLWRRQPQRA